MSIHNYSINILRRGSPKIYVCMTIDEVEISVDIPRSKRKKLIWDKLHLFLPDTNIVNILEICIYLMIFFQPALKMILKMVVFISNMHFLAYPDVLKTPSQYVISIKMFTFIPRYFKVKIQKLLRLVYSSRNHCYIFTAKNE